MPRSRCHFALSNRLHERLRREAPEAAAILDRQLPDFLAGAVAPDGLRYVARMGKRDTHFYSEDDEETWGRSVSRMFETHAGLADPNALPEPDRALVMGYIGHLAVDEAFRDTVTFQLHGTEDWKPVVEGLWSRVDEIDLGYRDAGAALDRFVRVDGVGFIRCDAVGEFIRLVRPWADPGGDAWEIEKVFLRLARRSVPPEACRGQWEENRHRAAGFMDAERCRAFEAAAVKTAFGAVRRYLDGEFRPA
jgi:hypothetical protein